MRKLDLTRDAVGVLVKLEAKPAKQIWGKIVGLMKDSRPGDSIDIGEGYFRTSIGEYRIVYKFDATTIYVVLVGKRNDAEVYRDLKNKRR